MLQIEDRKAVDRIGEVAAAFEECDFFCWTG